MNFKEKYREQFHEIIPSASLTETLLQKASGKDRRHTSGRYLFDGKSLTAMTAAACLCLVLGLPVMAARIEYVYPFLYQLSPEIAQYFVPVQESCEDQGIRMEVTAVRLQENRIQLYVSMQDLTGSRIDATTDLFDSYSIHRSFDSTGSCQKIDYNEDTNTVTFLITLEEWGNQKIDGEKVTFSVKEFISQKTEYEDIKLPIAMSDCIYEAESMVSEYVTGYSGAYESSLNEADVQILVPQSPLDTFPVEGLDLTGIGYLNGDLHIQLAAENYLENDNHGWLFLRDSAGNEISPDYSLSFVNHYEEEGRIDYQEFVFALPPDQLSAYSLHGSFVTSGLKTEGNWKVTVPLEQKEP